VAAEETKELTTTTSKAFVGGMHVTHTWQAVTANLQAPNLSLPMKPLVALSRPAIQPLCRHPAKHTITTIVQSSKTEGDCNPLRSKHS